MRHRDESGRLDLELDRQLVGCRQGPKLGHRTDELHAYDESRWVSWLLNCAEEPAETTDWGRAFQSVTVLML